jgi:hypothetical protein
VDQAAAVDRRVAERLSSGDSAQSGFPLRRKKGHFIQYSISYPPSQRHLVLARPLPLPP